MLPTPTSITPKQWQKVLKALYYSFSSGFVGGLVLSLSGVLGGIVNGAGGAALGKSAVLALVVGAVVGGLNSLAVAVKQLYTAGS